MHPIFLGRKLLCLAPPPRFLADETLLIQTVFYPTWYVSLTCEIHKPCTVPYNQHSQSTLTPLVEEGSAIRAENRLLCSGSTASSRWKHGLPPSPPVTTRHTHLFQETQTLAGTTHPVFATGLCTASNLSSCHVG